MLQRNSEEPLKSRGVEVQRDYTFDARALDQVRDKTCSHRITPGCTPVLPGVAKLRNDRGQSFRAGASTRIGEEQQLHEILVRRR